MRGAAAITLEAHLEKLASEGRLPVHVRVACDGEEEIGGHSIVDFLADDDRGADAAVIFDSGMTKRGIRMHAQSENLKFDDNISVPVTMTNPGAALP